MVYIKNVVMFTFDTGRLNQTLSECCYLFKRDVLLYAVE
jgi:hypothetical protein